MRRLSLHRFSSHRRPPTDDPLAPILAFVASLMAVLIVMILLLPQPVVLPAFSLWALAAAGALALLAATRRSRAQRPLTAWDIAGAFTLIGCAAAIIGEIEPVLDYIRPAAPRSNAHD